MQRADTSLGAAQYAFAGAIRDPGRLPPAGVAPERLAIYRELFFNNVRGSLESAYPVLREVLEPGLWQRLIEGFFRDHRCTTPEFPRMPREFLHWLDGRERPEPDEPGFLRALALWEWTELEVLLEPAPAARPLPADADLLLRVPEPTPTLRLYAFDYPVHRIGPGFLPDAPLEVPVHLAAYRDRHDEVAFLELTPAGAALLHQMVERPGSTGAAQVVRLAGELGAPQPEPLFEFAAGFLGDLYDKGVLIGASKTNKGLGQK